MISPKISICMLAGDGRATGPCPGSLAAQDPRPEFELLLGVALSAER